MGTQITQNFGQCGLNLCASLGVQQAQETIKYQTRTLAMQCKLQKEVAEELAGYNKQGHVTIGQDGSIDTGLIGAELKTQISAAQNAGQSIMDEAYGTLSSAISATIGTIGTGVVLAKVGAPKELNDKVAELKTFKTKLDAPIGRESTVLGDEDEDDVTDQQVEDRIQQWKGSSLKEADLSEKDDVVANKALRKLKDASRQEDLKTVKGNVDREILKTEERALSDKSQRQNTFTNVLSQASNAAQSYSQSGGKMAQAGATTDSQLETAYAGIYEKAVQNANELYSQASQAANARESEITSTIQAIAFPA